MDPRGGFEPPLTGSEPAVLPLDDRGTRARPVCTGALRFLNRARARHDADQRGSRSGASSTSSAPAASAGPKPKGAPRRRSDERPRRARARAPRATRPGSSGARRSDRARRRSSRAASRRRSRRPGTRSSSRGSAGRGSGSPSPGQCSKRRPSAVDTRACTKPTSQNSPPPSTRAAGAARERARRSRRPPATCSERHEHERQHESAERDLVGDDLVVEVDHRAGEQRGREGAPDRRHRRARPWRQAIAAKSRPVASSTAG